MKKIIYFIVGILLISSVYAIGERMFTITPEQLIQFSNEVIFNLSIQNIEEFESHGDKYGIRFPFSMLEINPFYENDTMGIKVIRIYPEAELRTDQWMLCRDFYSVQTCGNLLINNLNGFNYILGNETGYIVPVRGQKLRIFNENYNHSLSVKQEAQDYLDGLAIQSEVDLINEFLGFS